MRANSPSSFKMLSVLLSIFPLATLSAGLNDWSKPCFQGECYYDLPPSDTEASGSLKIWGSPNAISDITEAAGWAIIGCNPNATIQDIRLVCLSDDNAAGCDHLYQSSGAVNKIVRLPNDCGKNAFARVANMTVSQNQQIPAHVAKRLVRRDGTPPQVKTLSLDTNWGAINHSLSGNVSFALQGSNVPGQNGNFTVTTPTPSSRRRSNVGKRDFVDFVKNSLQRFNNFNETATKELPPFNFSTKSVTIISRSFPCKNAHKFGAKIQAGATVKGHAQIAMGVAAVGTMVPPVMTQFGAYAGIISGQIDGILDLKSFVTGTISSPRIPLFEVGIPGLHFPGIIALGPMFQIAAQTTATLDVGLDTQFDLSYTIQDAKLFFPPIPDCPPSGGTFTPRQQPFNLSVTPGVFSKATVAAHIIPSLQIGVNAFEGYAKANIFLDFDHSAYVGLGLKAATPIPVPLNGTTIDPSTNLTTTVTGCVDGGFELNVNAGASTAFFSLFDLRTSVSLFDKKFPVFEKCRGTQFNETVGDVKSALGARAAESHQLQSRAGLSCPALPFGVPVRVT